MFFTKLYGDMSKAVNEFVKFDPGREMTYIDVHSSAANWSSGQIFITSIKISLIIFFVFQLRLSKTYSLNLSLKNTQGLYVFERLK